jgi:hypothetical protein
MEMSFCGECCITGILVPDICVGFSSLYYIIQSETDDQTKNYHIWSISENNWSLFEVLPYMKWTRSAKWERYQYVSKFVTFHVKINLLELAVIRQHIFLSQCRDYGLEDRGIGVRDLGRLRIFCFPRCSDWPWGPPSLISNGYLQLFPSG